MLTENEQITIRTLALQEIASVARKLQTFAESDKESPAYLAGKYLAHCTGERMSELANGDVNNPIPNQKED